MYFSFIISNNITQVHILQARTNLYKTFSPSQICLSTFIFISVVFFGPHVSCLSFPDLWKILHCIHLLLVSPLIEIVVSPFQRDMIDLLLFFVALRWFSEYHCIVEIIISCIIRVLITRQELNKRQHGRIIWIRKCWMMLTHDE